MKNYVMGCMEEYEQNNLDQILRKCATPAITNKLFKVWRESKVDQLSKVEATQFHSIVSKLLFLAKRGRLDILSVVSFLITRVLTAMIGKMMKVLGYLNDRVWTDHIMMKSRNFNMVHWRIVRYTWGYEMPTRSNANARRELSYIEIK